MLNFFLVFLGSCGFFIEKSPYCGPVDLLGPGSPQTGEGSSRLEYTSYSVLIFLLFSRLCTEDLYNWLRPRNALV